MHRKMTFPGDQTADYHHETQAGTVGKVVRGASGWFMITAAVHNPETDRTTCELSEVTDPNVRLAQVTCEPIQ